MALFQKKTPEPEPSAPAPASPDLERKVRGEIWNHISPALAAAAGLSLPELLEFVSGARRLSHAQVTTLARRMGFVTAPATGLDVLRDMVVARLKQSALSKATLDELGLDRTALAAFSEGSDLPEPQLGALAKLFFDASFDPVANVLKPLEPRPVTPLCAGYPPPAKGRPIEEIMGDGCVRVGLSWNTAGRAPKTVRDVSPPREAPAWPRKAGWA
jgi:hypothetical protein